MLQHIKFVHEKCDDFKCPDCGYLFSDRIKLANHKKTVHDKIKDRICEHCGAGFSNRFNLRDHVKVIHMQIREFRCDECAYESATRSNLKKHLIQMSHTSKLDKLDFGNEFFDLIDQRNGATLQSQAMAGHFSQVNGECIPMDKNNNGNHGEQQQTISSKISDA